MTALAISGWIFVLAEDCNPDALYCDEKGGVHSVRLLYPWEKDYPWAPYEGYSDRHPPLCDQIGKPWDAETCIAEYEYAIMM
jgi:hypothetical protein